MSDEIVERNVAKLFAMFPSWQKSGYSAATVAGYHDELKRIPADRLDAVVARVVRTHQHLPSAQDIHMAHIKMFAVFPSLDDVRQNLLRWIDNAPMISRTYDGYCRPPGEWPDVVTAETVKNFGWKRFQSETGTPDLFYRDLDKAYQAAIAVVMDQVLAGDWKISSDGTLIVGNVTELPRLEANR